MSELLHVCSDDLIQLQCVWQQQASRLPLATANLVCVMTDNRYVVPGNQSRIQTSTSETQIDQISYFNKSPCLNFHRCVYPDRGGGSDDGRWLPRLLRSHQGVAVHAGIGKWFNTVDRIFLNLSLEKK